MKVRICRKQSLKGRHNLGYIKCQTGLVSSDMKSLRSRANNAKYHASFRELSSNRLSLNQASRSPSAGEIRLGQPLRLAWRGRLVAVPLPRDQMSHMVLRGLGKVCEGGCKCSLIHISVPISPSDKVLIRCQF